MANLLHGRSAFSFEPEVECFMPIKDIFSTEQPSLSIADCCPPAKPQTTLLCPHPLQSHPSGKNVIASACHVPAARRGSLSASEIKDSVCSEASAWVLPSIPLDMHSMVSSPPIPYDDGMDIHSGDVFEDPDLENVFISNAGQATSERNYFWNQGMSMDTPRNASVALIDFNTDERRNVEASSSAPCLWETSTIEVEPLAIEVRHPLWEGCSPRSSRGKQRSRKNKKALYWTPEDHDKFLQGLEQFGLQDGLGHGGAELMAVFMGNRSVLQIKSHMQKYLSDRANGKSGSPSPRGRSGSDSGSPRSKSTSPLGCPLLGPAV